MTAARPTAEIIADQEYIEFRGRRWFVADIQDDVQHMHLTIVPVSVLDRTPERDRVGRSRGFKGDPTWRQL